MRPALGPRAHSGPIHPGRTPRPDPRPGRPRARLSGLLPALALLLGALSLFAAAPAQAQTVWSATLAMERSDRNIGCANTFSPDKRCNNPSVLSDDEFSVGGQNYKITEIVNNPSTNNLRVIFSTTVNNALRNLNFCVGTKPYPLSTIQTGSILSVSTLLAGWAPGNTVGLSIGSSCEPSSLRVKTSRTTPACGELVTDLSLSPSLGLQLTPAPAMNSETERRVIHDNTRPRWLSSLPVQPSGYSFAPLAQSTFAQLRQTFPGFRGFEYRLKDTPGVTARCTWRFPAQLPPEPVPPPPPTSGPLQTLGTTTFHAKRQGGDRGCFAGNTCNLAFTHGGTSYRLNRISRFDATLNVNFNPAPSTKLKNEGVVKTGGRTFALSDATVTGSLRRDYVWTNAPRWATGQRVTVSMAAPPPPEFLLTPASLRVTPGDRRLTLRWQAPAPPEARDSIRVHGYEAAYRCGSGAWISHGASARSDGRFDDPLSRQTTRVIDGLVPGAAYEVRVRASMFLFTADGRTTRTGFSDWVYGTATPSGAGGSTSCGDTNARLRNLRMNTGN